jgi:hypothetical protein
MASAVALAPMNTLDEFFLAMGLRMVRQKLFQDTNVLQIDPKLAEMSENRQLEHLFCNKCQKPQNKVIKQYPKIKHLKSSSFSS